MIRRFRAVFAAILLGLVAVLGSSSIASAHSDEFLSVPANGSVVTEVNQLQFTFVEPVEQSFPPEIVLTSYAGTNFELGAPSFDASGATMTVPIVQGALPNGNYSVVYRIVSIDGHPATGQVDFTVEGAATEPAPVETPVPVDEPVVTEDMLRTTTVSDPAAAQMQLALGFTAAGAVVLALVIVIIAMRRRRNSQSK